MDGRPRISDITPYFNMKERTRDLGLGPTIIPDGNGAMTTLPPTLNWKAS